MSGTDRVRMWSDRLAASRHDLGFIGVLSFMEALIIPIPLELILIPYMVKEQGRAWQIATAALAGCLIGALVGYGIGLALFETVGRWILEALQYTEQFEAFRNRFEENGFWAIVLVGVVPIPFQVAMLVAGTAAYPVALFLIASGIARGIRYYGLAVLVVLFGSQARALWEKHSKAVGAVLLVLAVATIGYYAATLI